MSRGKPACNKCRQAIPAEGDTWCTWCSGVQLLGNLAREKFHSLAFRNLAAEIVNQSSRQCQALLTLDRRTQGAIESAQNRGRPENRSSLPDGAGRESSGLQPTGKAAPREPLPRTQVKVEEKTSEKKESGEEEESSEESIEVKAPKPPEPPDPPPQAKRGRSRSRHRGRRGGSKHQQKHRQLYEPEREFHRKPKVEPIQLEERRRKPPG